VISLTVASFGIAYGLDRILPGRWLRLVLGLPAT
jgi:hypothetical protein